MKQQHNNAEDCIGAGAAHEAKAAVEAPVAETLNFKTI